MEPGIGLRMQIEPRVVVPGCLAGESQAVTSIQAGSPSDIPHWYVPWRSKQWPRSAAAAAAAAALSETGSA